MPSMASRICSLLNGEFFQTKNTKREKSRQVDKEIIKMSSIQLGLLETEFQAKTPSMKTPRKIHRKFLQGKSKNQRKLSLFPFKSCVVYISFGGFASESFEKLGNIVIASSTQVALINSYAPFLFCFSWNSNKRVGFGLRVKGREIPAKSAAANSTEKKMTKAKEKRKRRAEVI